MVKNSEMIDDIEYDDFNQDLFDEKIEEFEEDDRDIVEALYFNEYKNVIIISDNKIYFFDNVQKIYDFDGSSLFIKDKNSKIFGFSEPRDYTDIDELENEGFLRNFNFTKLRLIFNNVNNCIIFTSE